MNFAQRLKYYLIGIGLGIIVVFIFFGKRTFQCSYFPNARALDEAKFYPINYSPEVKSFFTTHKIDTTFVKEQLFNRSTITNFGTEEVKAKPCRIYRANYENADLQRKYEFVYQICKDFTYIQSIKEVN